MGLGTSSISIKASPLDCLECVEEAAEDWSAMTGGRGDPEWERLKLVAISPVAPSPTPPAPPKYVLSLLSDSLSRASRSTGWLPWLPSRKVKLVACCVIVMLRGVAPLEGAGEGLRGEVGPGTPTFRFLCCDGEEKTESNETGEEVGSEFCLLECGVTEEDEDGFLGDEDSFLGAMLGADALLDVGDCAGLLAGWVLAESRLETAASGARLSLPPTGDFLAETGEPRELPAAMGEPRELLAPTGDFFAAIGEFCVPTGEAGDFLPATGDSSEPFVPTEELLAATGEFLAATGEFLAATGEFLAATGEFLAATGEFLAATGELLAAAAVLVDFLVPTGELLAAAAVLTDFLVPTGELLASAAVLVDFLVPTGELLAAAAVLTDFLVPTGDCLAVVCVLCAEGALVCVLCAEGALVCVLCAAFSSMVCTEGALDADFLVLCKKLGKKLLFRGFCSAVAPEPLEPLSSTLPSRCSMGVA